MWQKKESKLELAASMIRQVMPEFHSKDHVIILCDSWYTKQNLVSIIDEYPNLDLIGNARIDSVMYDLAPAQHRSSGDVLPNMENVFLLKQILLFPMKRSGDYYTGVRRVLDQDLRQQGSPCLCHCHRKRAWYKTAVLQHCFSGRSADFLCMAGKSTTEPDWQ